MQDEKLKAQAPKFETLDGLRGVGALIVLVGHTILFWIGGPIGPIAAPVMVDMFFMLSGFVVAFAYEPKITRGLGVGKFMEARLVRLYPLFLLSMVLGLGVHLAIAYGETEKWLMPLPLFAMSALFVPLVDFDYTNIYPLNMPAWTLLYELLVNLIYIIVWRWLNLRLLIIFIIAGALGLIAAGAAFGTLNIGADVPSTIGAFARAWFGFFVGVLIYRLFAKNRKVALPRSWLALLLIAAVIGIAVIPLAEMGAVLRITSELALICLIGPLVIYFGQRMEPPRAFAKILVWLGSISYALYLLHWPIYTAALRIPAKIGMSPEQTAPVMGFVILIVSVTAAAIAERYYDRPARKWLGDVIRGFRERRAARTLAAVAAKSAGQVD